MTEGGLNEVREMREKKAGGETGVPGPMRFS